MRLEADGMLGAILASESLGLTDTMINGAGGCRSRSQIVMHDAIPSYYPENQSCCRSKYFSQQSRLPCTYLNNEDIVFGTAEKVSRGIESVASITGRRALLLDTLGASLLCTDYSGLTGNAETDPIQIQGDLSAMSMAEGYDVTVRTLLSSVDIEDGDDGSVNVLGYGLMDFGWEAGEKQLRSILESMGLRVNCMMGCLPKKEEILSCGKASLNIMIHPEFCRQTAEMLKERFGTDYLRLSMGAPVGYQSVRSFIREVASATGKDPTLALSMVDKDAEEVHRHLMNYERIPVSLHAKGFVIKAESSIVYPLMRWMMETFGMVPRHIIPLDDEYGQEIRDYLAEHGFQQALEGCEGEIEAVFSDGMDALKGSMAVSTTGYVEIRPPRSGYMDLMDRTIVGISGCRYVLDAMMNGITRFRCGQPTEVMYRPGYEEE
ncbi:nitrogenase-related protein [methanogenic archaeon mixed culture ISO4-G1]|nr:nitrogenase-related protein [methanogenic archaeon mixed culture ISO4-G1]